MREKIAPREFWNRRSQHYDEQSGAAYADAYRKTAERIRPYLTPNDRVLDFACGTGLVTLPVAQMAAEVGAIDISDDRSVERGPQRRADIGKRGDGVAVQLADHIFLIQRQLHRAAAVGK